MSTRADAYTGPYWRGGMLARSWSQTDRAALLRHYDFARQRAVTCPIYQGIALEYERALAALDRPTRRRRKAA